MIGIDKCGALEGSTIPGLLAEVAGDTVASGGGFAVLGTEDAGVLVGVGVLSAAEEAIGVIELVPLTPLMISGTCRPTIALPSNLLLSSQLA